jgi:replicative DNA helicase
MPQPHNAEVEGALIARLLVDPAQIPLVAGDLSPSDIYTLSWRRAFQAMTALSAEGKSVDLGTLRDALGDQGESLSRLLGEVGLSFRAPLADYIAIIKRDAFRRRVIGQMEAVIGRAYDDGVDRGSLLASIQDASSAIVKGTEDGQLISPTQAIDLYQQVTEARRDGKQTGLNYGYATLNRVLNPARGGDMIVVAARPSVGKTALAENIAEIWSRQTPHPILFASLEMSVTMLLDRTMARNSDVAAHDIIRGTMSDEQRLRVLSQAEAHRTSSIWYLDDGFATTATVRSTAAKLRLLSGGIGAIIIDYLQLLKDPGDQEVQRVTRISREVKATAREFDVPVLVLSQLSRAVESREDKHPRLHDLRESGAIEQDADVVIGLMRRAGDPYIDIEVLKQRQGEVGRRTMFFDMAHHRFSEVPEGGWND